MPCFSIVLSLGRLAKSAPKNGSCGGSAAQDVDKICTTLWCESDLEVKIVKNWQARSTLGRLEGQFRKICTTLWLRPESDSEVKTVKNWLGRSSFGSSARQNLHRVVARERFGSQNR